MGGWIKLYDKMLNWEWYGNTNVVRVFLHCLLKANYQQKVWQGITIERGQFITSVAIMSAELGLTTKQVRGALMKLQKSNNIAIKGANKFSTITVCNYDSYQSFAEDEGQTKGQATGQAKGQTKVTQKGNNNRYTDNTDNTEKQNNKNTTPNGDSVKSAPRFRKPSIEELQEYAREKGYTWDVERFYNHYESNGWKVGRNAMKNWKASMSNWNKGEHGGQKPQPQQPQLFNQNEDAEREAAMKRIEAAKAEAGRRQAEKERQEREEAERQRIERLNALTGFDYQPNNNNNDE